MMTNYQLAIAILAMSAASSNGFVVAPMKPSAQTALSSSSTNHPYFVDVTEDREAEVATAVKSEITTPKKKALTKKKATAKPHGKDGIFTPAVKLAKVVMGDKDLNQLRGKVIAKHTEVIRGFVDTSETEFGQAVLKQLYNIADVDSDGTIDKEELTTALQSLGFTLKDKQINGIFERADADSNGRIDMNEWIANAPKTLSTNLIKLAKKNGGDLGFLS